MGEDITTIQLTKTTRYRLARFCGKTFDCDAGKKTYDEAVNELLDIAEEKKRDEDVQTL